MASLIWKLPVALAAMTLMYLIGAGFVRNFAKGHLEPQEADLPPLTDVDYRFRCVVCSLEVAMYAAPDGEIPLPPRHCAERMDLITPVT